MFLHDPRCIASNVYFPGGKKKSKEELCVDGLFWPTLTKEQVSGKLDSRKLPHISQPYDVPQPATHPQQHSHAPSTGTVSIHITKGHAWAVYSVWQHYLDFLYVDELSVVRVPRQVSALTFDPWQPVNGHTGKARLPVFVQLALSGEAVGREHPHYAGTLRQQVHALPVLTNNRFT